MKKLIKITGQQMVDMGWYIGKESTDEKFTLTIDTEKRNIKINLDGADLLDWGFEYEAALADLDYMDLLPCGIFETSTCFYNNHIFETSSMIEICEISEICGDMLQIELTLYSTLAELNNEIIGFSFSENPEY